jgi:enoyl-CoA hydratase/3-hydroxyacyl-CoA dehydrogenase
MEFGEVLLRKKRISREQADEAFGRIRITTNFGGCRGLARDLVIEAVPERDLKLRRRFFERVSRAAPRHAIIASNTSTLPITELAATTDRPGEFCRHAFSSTPPPLMPLLEVIKGEKTSEGDLAGRLLNWVRRWGKTVCCMQEGCPRLHC